MTSPQSSAHVIVISARHDAHIPFVEKHLRKSFILIDPQDLVNGAGLTFSYTDKVDKIIYNSETLDNISGVWYRKPRSISPETLPVADNFKRYSQGSIERLASQLQVAFPEATWVSSYFAIQQASNKTLQLRIARQCGFNIPPTVITSDKQEAKAFIRTYSPSVSKPLTTAFPMVNDRQKVLVTTQIGNGFMPNLDSLHLAPSIFQQALDVSVEVRATVVGKRVFAASVRSDMPSDSEHNEHIRDHIRDNRYGHYEGSVHISSFSLPEDIAYKCIAHVQALGLNFGAIDLVLDKKGIWWFLENNPNGQWAYIEDATGLPIGKAIAELLSEA